MNPLDEQNQKAAIAKALDVMWEKFLPDIRERISILDEAADAASSDTLADELREAAMSAAHKLAGTLGTFGLTQGTNLARELELRFARGGIAVDEALGLKDSARQMRAIIESRESATG